MGIEKGAFLESSGVGADIRQFSPMEKRGSACLLAGIVDEATLSAGPCPSRAWKPGGFLRCSSGFY